MKKNTKKIFYGALLLLPMIALANPVPALGPFSRFDDSIFGSLMNFLLYLAITILCELTIGFLYFRSKKISNKGLIWIVVVNLISWPIFYAVLEIAIDSVGFLIALPILEIIIMIFEGFFVYYFIKKNITLRSALVLSVIMNIVSFIVPIILSIIYFLMIN